MNGLAYRHLAGSMGSFPRENLMPTSQLILLVLIGVVAMAWGAHLDLKNRRKEKAERQAAEQREA